MVTRAEIVLAAKDTTQAAFASISRSFDSIEAKAVSVRTSAAGVAGGVASIASAVGGAFIVAQGKNLIDMLDGLDDMSEKTGINVEKLSELRYAGEAAGTPLDALGSGFSRLAKLMGEAASGNKDAAATFKTLGVEYRNADGTLRDTDEVLGDLAERFAGYEDGAGKAALAQKIFGKSGAEMIPLLNLGRQGIADLRVEAQQLSAIYGADLAREAAAFNDNLTKLHLASEAAAVSVGGPLLKSLNGFLNQALELKKLGSLDLVIKDAALGFLDPNLSKLSLSGAGDVKRLMREREVLQAQIDKTFKDAAPGAYGQEIAATINAPKQRELAEIDRFLNVAKARQRMDALAGANPEDANDAVSRRFDRPEAKRQTPVVPSSGSGSGRGEKKDPESATLRYLESLDKQLEKTRELSQVEMALTEIQRLRADGGTVSEAQKQSMLRMAAEIDIVKEREKVQKDADRDREEGQRRFIADQDEARRVVESTYTPLETYSQKLADLATLKAKGVLTSEQHSKAIAREAAAYGEAQAQAEEAGKHVDQFAQRGAQNIQDALGQGLADTLNGNFDDIGKNFGNLIKRMAAEAAAAQLSRALFGDLVQGGSGSGLFGAALGGLGAALGFGGSTGYSAAQMSSLDGLITGLSGARAAGGPVGADGTYLVGERGPELFTPSSSGTIIPNHELGGGGGGITITHAPSFHVDSRADRGAVIADMQKVSAASNKELIEELKRRKVLPQ